MSASLRWSFQRFDHLSAIDLYEALALRAEVFVVEQDCPFQDADGVDPASWHLLGRDSQGKLIAYLRIVDPGVKYPEPSIGRVVSSPSVRGQGIGRQLLAEGIRRGHALWPGQTIRIGAQHRLLRFYEEFGFASVGEIYIEDNIPHIEMLLAG